MCEDSPKCRHDHRLKQQPGWTVDQLPDGTFRWITAVAAVVAGTAGAGAMLSLLRERSGSLAAPVSLHLAANCAGALSSHRVALGRGAEGAVPHRHDHSSELFYILHGAFDVLVEDNVVTARTGDLLVVPPGSAHAFAAHHDSTAEALIIATPGIERFDYFRHVVRRRQGSEPPEALLGLQDRFDTHFLDSPAWQRARSTV